MKPPAVRVVRANPGWRVTCTHCPHLDLERDWRPEADAAGAEHVKTHGRRET